MPSPDVILAQQREEQSVQRFHVLLSGRPVHTIRMLHAEVDRRRMLIADRSLETTWSSMRGGRTHLGAALESVIADILEDRLG